MRIATSFVALACFAAGAVGQATFQDGDFADGSWGFELVEAPNPSGAIASAEQVTGGNPGFALRVRVDVDADAGDRAGALNRFGTTRDTRYVPGTMGAIVAVDAEFDVRSVAAPANARVAFALKQAFVTFVGPELPPPTGAAWESRRYLALSQDLFTRFDDPGVHPDFSDGGPPIRFGLILLHESAGAASTAIVEFDNFFAKAWNRCPGDLDDGSGSGTPDGGVDIGDLLYFLANFENGDLTVDLDDGSRHGVPDQGVDVNDLLFFLERFEIGC